MTPADTPAGRELYVYWKAHHLASALAACAELQARLRREVPGLHATTLQREDRASNGAHTVMEVYRHPQGVGSDLEQVIHAAAHAALAPWLASPRVSEVFIVADARMPRD